MAFDNFGFQPFDPLAQIERQAGVPLFRRSRKKAPRLNPEEEASVARKLGSTVLSGVERIGNLLDVPGSMVRDVVAGENPIDQLLSPFTSDNRTQGRQFWKQPGDPDTWGNFAAGLATEIALDPLTYLTLGMSALSKGGKLAKGAGLIDDALTKAKMAGKGAREFRMTTTLQDLVNTSPNPVKALEKVETFAKQQGLNYIDFYNEPLGGLARAHVPFTGAEKVFGQGKLAQKIGRGLDQAGLAAKATYPARLGAALFDYETRGVLGGEPKSVMDAFLPNREAYSRQGRARLGYRRMMRRQGNIRQNLASHAESMRQTGILDPAKHSHDDVVEAGMFLHRLMETGQMGNVPAHVQPHLQEITNFANTARKYLDRQIRLERSAGLKVEYLDDIINYNPRERLFFDKDRSLAYGRSVLDITNPNALARSEALRGIPGGTETIQRLSISDLTVPIGDPSNQTVKMEKISGLRHRLSRPEDWTVYRDSVKDAIRNAGIDIGTADENQLASFLMNLDPRHADQKIPAFHLDPTENLIRRMEHGQRALSASKGVLDWLGEVADDVHRYPSMKSVEAVIHDLGMDPKRAARAIVRKIQANPDLANRLEQKGINLNAAPTEVVKQLHVPMDFAKDLTKYMQSFNSPAEVKGALAGYDYLLRLFKTSVTSPWPGFHFRNLISGQHQNWIGNATDPRHKGPMAIVQPVLDTLALLTDSPTDMLGKEVKFSDIPLFSNLSEQEARTKLRAMLFGRKIVGRGQTYTDDMVRSTTLGHDALDAFGRSVGTRTYSALSTPAKSLKEAAIPRGLGLEPGLPGTRAAKTYLRAATDVGEFIEQLNRISPTIALLRRGNAVDEVVRRVKTLQIDYGALTAAERNVMRRVFPFYCVPTDHEILTRDGWKTYDQLRVGEEVLAYDVDADECRWTPAREVAVFDYDDDLMKWETSRKGKKISFEFTPDHRWPVEQQLRKYVGGRYVNGSTRRSIKRGQELIGNDRLIGAAPARFPVESILSPRYAAILGWVVTDGYMRWRGNYCEMLVYQSPGKHLDEITALLGTKPRKPHPDTGVCAVPVRLDDVKQIITVYRDKMDLPGIVTRLSKEAAVEMLAAMMHAEGSNCNKDGTRQSFAQDKKNPHVRDAFQILVGLFGSVGNMAKHCIYVRKRRYYKVTKKTLSSVHYRGKIWCPRTDLGTWVMRHNGNVVITGNTFSRRMMPMVFEELTERPGAKLGQTLRVANEVRESDARTPDYVAESLGAKWNLPFLKPEEGTDRYVSGIGAMAEDPLQLLGPLTGIGQGGGREALIELISRSSPLPKAAMEWAFGESAFMRGPEGGRSLEDLDPNIGRIASNIKDLATGSRSEYAMDLPDWIEHAAANSPASRVLSTVRGLTDTRKQIPIKALNVLTGVRVHDVSPAAQNAILQERGAKLMRANRAKTFEKTYFPEALKEHWRETDPEQFQEAVQLEALQNTIADKRRASKRQKALSAMFGL